MTTAQLPTPIPVRLWLRPSPRPGNLLGEFRRIVREELRAIQDRQSFATASPWMTQAEAQAYLKLSRTALYERRLARKLAKTSEAAAQAFAREYGSGSALRFRRDELDAWMARQ